MKNICLTHGCSECCNPVKIDSKYIIGDDHPFFVFSGEILIPEKHPESIRLKTYTCKFFDQEKGVCKDYKNRPSICKNTICVAFNTNIFSEQAEIIDGIKREKFFRVLSNPVLEIPIMSCNKQQPTNTINI